MSPSVPCQPLSFETCAQFVVEFDRLYQGRSSGDLSNPTRKDPAISLHDKGSNLKEIFENVNFITGYVFDQNESTGVVSRSFSSNMRADEPRPITFINPTTGKALGLSDGSCGPRLEAQEPNPANEDQLFHVKTDGRIASAKTGCETKVITVAEISDGVFRCKDGARLVLSQGNDNSEPLRQTWRMYSDGHIVSQICPSLAISYVEHGSLAVASQPESDEVHSVHVTSEFAEVFFSSFDSFLIRAFHPLPCFFCGNFDSYQSLQQDISECFHQPPSWSTFVWGRWPNEKYWAAIGALPRV